MDGKTAIAKILAAEGVEHVTCFPMNPLIEAAAIEGIRPIVTRTERVAVNIADGLARVTNGRRPGVVMMQHGPGVENAFGGVAQAYGDHSPVLLLPGAFPRPQQGVPPNFDAPRSYAAVTKWAETVHVAARIPQMLRRAFTLLRNGTPGPVMLEVPMDVMREEVADGPLPWTRVRASRPHGDPADVRELVRMLLAAKAPVVLAGQGILYAEATAELVAFAELARVPVLTTLNGKSAFPEDHPLALGTGGMSGTLMVDHFLRKADLVVGLGTSFTRSTFIVKIPAGKTIVQVTIDESDVNKDYPIAHAVLGDAKAVLRQLAAELTAHTGPGGRADGAVTREIAAVKARFLGEWMGELTADDEPISPYRVIHELAQTIDRARTVVTHDAGNPRDQVVPFFEATTPRGYLGWGKSTPLGSGLGLVMGAKLGAPDKLCVNVMGDAAFGMVGMDFETAVRARIPILTIVLNNGAMGGYDKHIPVATERYGSRFLSGDYAKVAEGLGGYTERVEKCADLGPALRRAIAEVEHGRPTLLEVRTREAKYPVYW